MFKKMLLGVAFVIMIATPVHNPTYSRTPIVVLFEYIKSQNPTISNEDAGRTATALLAVSSSKQELKTLVAIARVESNFRNRVVGDGGKSVGMFQIQPKLWGYVHPTDVFKQARKAKDVLTHLRKRGNPLYRNRYNGSGRKAVLYAQKIRKIEKEVSRLLWATS